ncbi:MAG: NAD-binding protein [Desulforhopalus sp.]|jgi:Trk K+ transport system NAD-binding subunit|nr:NAD-binding protein [Desulforhopalus sp.]
MKFLPSQLMFFFQNKSTRQNAKLLAKFVGLLLIIILIFSFLFHQIMLLEGRNYSWISGVYWTLVTMSTLGFGDITFTSDLGYAFSVVVLSSGVLLLLVMLPFSFIQFFYAPWIEAQSRLRTSRELPEGTEDHVIITNLEPITEKLIGKLDRRHINYVLVVPEPQRAAELYDAGYKVVVGDPDDPDTFLRLRIEGATLVVATNDDLTNTSIAFTVREITQQVPVVVTADQVNSLDILTFPGNTHVFQFTKMLGKALAERTIGLGRPINIVSSFATLHIAEISAMQTSLGGKRLLDLDMPRKTGTMVVGLWEKGRFELPTPQTIIKSSTLLLLAGTRDQFDSFEAHFVTGQGTVPTDTPVLILGGGRVGLAVAETLKEGGLPYRIVEKRSIVTTGNDDNFVLGDAADIAVLEQAGLQRARTVIITTHNDPMNIYLTFYCRQLRPDIQVITRATSERSVAKLHMAGADLVLSYASMGANAIVNLLRKDEISMFTEGLNIFSRPMPKSLLGKNLVKSGIREKTGCSVIALKSASGLTVGPDPTQPLKESDELILIGTTEAEQKFLDIF